MHVELVSVPFAKAVYVCSELAVGTLNSRSKRR